LVAILAHDLRDCALTPGQQRVLFAQSIGYPRA
jgi:hypothetical protein